MSKGKDTKQEILPPAKRRDPQRGSAISVIGERPPESAKGVVDAVITGFVAGVQDRTIRKIEKRTRSQTALVQAQTELYDSGGKLRRSLEELRDIDATLDDDQAERDAAREEAAHQREEAAYRREDVREEREHQRTLARKRRLREQREADRSLFNAEQGLKKQEEVAPYMFGTWTAKAEGVCINERNVVEELRKEALERGAQQETARQQHLDELIRAQQLALARGDKAGAAEADRLQGEIDRINGNEETIYSVLLVAQAKAIEEGERTGADVTQLKDINQRTLAMHESELRARRRARENPDP
jgi:hypothetical protein